MSTVCSTVSLVQQIINGPVRLILGITFASGSLLLPYRVDLLLIAVELQNTIPQCCIDELYIRHLGAGPNIRCFIICCLSDEIMHNFFCKNLLICSYYFILFFYNVQFLFFILHLGMPKLQILRQGIYKADSMLVRFNGFQG